MIGELSEEEAAANLLNEENEPAEFQDDEGDREGGATEVVDLGWDGRGAHWTGMIQ